MMGYLLCLNNNSLALWVKKKSFEKSQIYSIKLMREVWFHYKEQNSKTSRQNFWSYKDISETNKDLLFSSKHSSKKRLPLGQEPGSGLLRLGPPLPGGRSLALTFFPSRSNANPASASLPHSVLGVQRGGPCVYHIPHMLLETRGNELHNPTQSGSIYTALLVQGTSSIFFT